ncbi:protoporphyrinogen oxidase [Planctomicrobium sp. SH527]|uniref:protoporphyrinogen oxidase n=1 Tax=Planctomicrobium sp. SH527 TaxID=3448123 RepID=UPI003F5C580E
MNVQPNPSSPSSEPLRIAVIGGGITGLAAAHRLLESRDQLPLKVTLFEGSDRLGGVFGTEQIGDYLVERGADSFITNKPGAVQLCRRLGIEDRLIPTNSRYRNSLILSKGKPVPTPDGFNLVAPGRIWPILTSPLLSWSGKLRVLLEPFIPARKDPADESVASFVSRRLGKQALERIVQPLVGGIYTSDPNLLSSQATLARFVSMERNYGSLYRGMRATKSPSADKTSVSGARYGLFATFPNGMQELLDALEARIMKDGEIRKSCRIQGLQKTESGWTLRTEQGEERFDGVVLSLSAPGAAQILKPVHDQCAQLIQQIDCASSAIVLTGHSLADIKHPVESFGLVIPHAENRRILATSFLSRKFDDRAPEGKVCIRSFVGGAMQPEEFARTDEEIIATVLSELEEILGVKGTPDFAIVARYPKAMPQFHVGHLQKAEAILQSAAEIPGFALAGNYLGGVGVPDCITSGETAAEYLIKQLSKPA